MFWVHGLLEKDLPPGSSDPELVEVLVLAPVRRETHRWVVSVHLAVFHSLVYCCFDGWLTVKKVFIDFTI